MIELLAGQGGNVVEKEIHITEIVDAIESGDLSCIFTTSTALGINNVTLLKHREDEHRLGAGLPDIIAAAKGDYRVLTEEFPSGLSKYKGIEERSHIGAIQPVG